MEKQYEVKVTQYAEQAMREIATYIAVDLLAPEVAIKYLRTLQEEIEKLDTMPRRIHLTPEEPWRTMGVHRMLVKNFYVYFWINEEQAVVQVTDVTYAKRQQVNRLSAMPMEDSN